MRMRADSSEFVSVILGFHYYMFFFKLKAAYEMRISDWSSDVCSSDLAKSVKVMVTFLPRLPAIQGASELTWDFTSVMPRSEERRVGKECVRTCRSRWSPFHYKTKNSRYQLYTATTVSLQ